MKLHKECLPCLLDTAVEQAELAAEDEEKQLKALKKFSKLLSSKFSGLYYI